MMVSCMMICVVSIERVGAVQGFDVQHKANDLPRNVPKAGSSWA